jgi:hypothetical protein
MDEFTSYISLNIDELSRNINLEKLVPELIRNNFLSGQSLLVYNNIVSEKMNTWNRTYYLGLNKPIFDFVLLIKYFLNKYLNFQIIIFD